MNLNLSYKRTIHEQLERAVKNAQNKCDSDTYVGYYGDEDDIYINEWDIIEHKLSNGLHVYTVVCPEWHNVNDNVYCYGIRSNKYNNNLKKEIDYVTPYPHTNRKYGLTIITVLSLHPLDEWYNIYMTRKYKDINFMIPEESEKAVLIYSNSSEDGKIKDTYRYVLGAREITSKEITRKRIDYDISGDPFVRDVSTVEHKIAWPVKEAGLDSCRERNRYKTIDTYGYYRMTNGKYMKSDVSDAKTIVDVISATLNSARKVQEFSETEVWNNVRRLNEKLGIIVKYPDEVEKLGIEEKKEAARAKISNLKVEKREIEKKLEKELAEIQRLIDKEERRIAEYDKEIAKYDRKIGKHDRKIDEPGDSR